jgi:hypothetical protein
LIARHLDIVGTADARSKASTPIASGETKIIARLGFERLAAAPPGSEA